MSHALLFTDTVLFYSPGDEFVVLTITVVYQWLVKTWQFTVIVYIGLQGVLWP